MKQSGLVHWSSSRELRQRPFLKTISLSDQMFFFLLPCSLCWEACGQMHKSCNDFHRCFYMATAQWAVYRQNTKKRPFRTELCSRLKLSEWCRDHIRAHFSTFQSFQLKPTFCSVGTGPCFMPPPRSHVFTFCFYLSENVLAVFAERQCFHSAAQSCQKKNVSQSCSSGWNK